MQFHRLSILGVGLMGGSLGLAVRSLANACRVVGYDHRPETLHKAVQLGALDHASESLAGAVEGADLIVLCTPVGMFGSILQQISKLVKPGTVVTDVGSTKRSVVRLAAEALPASVSFVGSHPMVGSEQRGVEHARADLFRGGVCIVTPDAQTKPAATESIERFWSALGMHVRRMSPEEHDRAVGIVSHLPHTVAAALVRIQDPHSLDVAGRGFIDTTRIAAGEASLWRDILLDNRDNLRGGIAQLRAELDQLLADLDAGEAEAVCRWLSTAAERRSHLPNRRPESSGSV